MCSLVRRANIENDADTSVNLQICRPSRTLTRDVAVEIGLIDSFTRKEKP